MKKPCDIVQDLLPLHIDGILKQETDEFVKEHLADCDRCKAAKNELWKSQIWKRDHGSALAKAAPQGGEMEFVERVRSWKRRTSVVGIVLIVVVSLISWFIGKTFQDDVPKPVIKPVVEQKTSMIHAPDEI